MSFKHIEFYYLAVFSNEISGRCRWLLKKVSVGACFLTREEIARAVKFLLPKHEKLANNIILSIYGMLLCINELKDTKRKTLVLIIDEVNMQCYVKIITSSDVTFI